jgi:dihydroorotate dehydrogenase
VSVYATLRPLLFRLPPETAHTLGKSVMKQAQSTGVVRWLVRRQYQYRDPGLTVEAFGLSFPTPVGVAAGFDKNGEVTHCLADLGFGFAEVGTVTPYPQPGNDRPRLFRLPEDGAMINRLGFNSQGAERVRERFEELGTPPVPVGANVGKMNTSDAAEAIEDYRRAFDRLYEFPDYFVVNVSCPNTPEEFDEDDPEHIEAIFETLDAENDADKPLLVKIGPDSTPAGLAELVDIVESVGFDGIVATNTTTDHSALTGRHRDEWGGVSGAPLAEQATETVRALAELTDLPIVGVGGVRDAADAYAKIRAGARLVQLYTGLVYEGPSTAHKLATGLSELLERDGFDSIEEAVGAEIDD